MPTEPLIRWPQPILEYLGFVASFLSTGAVGFRYGVIGRMPAAAEGPEAAKDRSWRAVAMRRAAGLGLAGVLLGSALLAWSLPALAARRHATVGQLVSGNGLIQAQIALLLLALAGFSLALGGRRPGWPLAALGVIAGALRAAFAGQWQRLVNPIHVLAGGMWIGTLLVLVAAGLASVLGSGLSAQRRGGVAAEMVNAFSPVALASAAVLATFGAITAAQHLKYPAAIWTTPYGFAFVTKLFAVMSVAGLGAWNWRRQRPQLGSEDAARSLRRSARAELGAAAVVLAITAVLVSLPTPRLPSP